MNNFALHNAELRQKLLFLRNNQRPRKDPKVKILLFSFQNYMNYHNHFEDVRNILLQETYWILVQFIRVEVGLSLDTKKS